MSRCAAPKITLATIRVRQPLPKRSIRKFWISARNRIS